MGKIASPIGSFENGAFGPTRTFAVAPHMSAFGGKADIPSFGLTLPEHLYGLIRSA